MKERILGSDGVVQFEDERGTVYVSPPGAPTLVARLRGFQCKGYGDDVSTPGICHEAANEIERLRAALEKISKLKGSNGADAVARLSLQPQN